MPPIFFFCACLALCSIPFTSEARRIRYHAQFSLQLSNLTYNDIRASSQLLFIVDPDNIQLTVEQNTALRLEGKTVLAYMSVGQAEAVRPYWQDSWRVGTPNFLKRADPEYADGVITEFWQPEWQATLRNYMTTNILPFGYSGILMDYLGTYTEFLPVRPTGAEDMVKFAASLAATARVTNPVTLIVTQDALGLYPISEEYRMMVDGISVEETFFTRDGKARSSTEVSVKLSQLREVANDKKVVLLEEYVEKNRNVCDFYKKCSLEEGFLCGVFDVNMAGVTRDCVLERTVKTH